MCRKNSSKSKMQQISLKINNKIQNDSPEFSIVGVISDISLASDFMTNR